MVQSILRMLGSNNIEQDLKALFKRVDEYIAQNIKYDRTIYSAFLTPYQIAAITSYFNDNTIFRFEGGYPEATMKRLIIGDSNITKIACLSCIINNNYIKLTHRDVFGALMNLGIRKEQFGDVIVDDKQVFIFVDEDIARFVIDNLVKINKLNVRFSYYEATLSNMIKLKVFQKAITSMRLDSIVSALINVSRTKAQSLIEDKMVFVNYMLLEEKSYLCNNDDTISVRGYGRYVIMEVVKTTKKQRLLLRLGKYE